MQRLGKEITCNGNRTCTSVFFWGERECHASSVFDNLSHLPRKESQKGSQFKSSKESSYKCAAWHLTRILGRGYSLDKTIGMKCILLASKAPQYLNFDLHTLILDENLII